MVTVAIDETTALGKRILHELSENSNVGQVKDFEIQIDENGVPIGYTVDEVFAEIDHNLSEHYGVDFAKVSLLINSGELDLDELTEELLLGPEFKYEPYPGFKPKPLSADFKPDPEIAALFSER
ncbi:MAG: hypothetical protein LBT25_00825 [Candidatus Symbiothrix sp.]|jgi:hypothetical protein|nr:hypothetical protein [Candidatus Symbiothrix sp.]